VIAGVQVIILALIPVLELNFPKNFYLKLGNEGIELGNRVLGGSGTGILLLQAGGKVGGLDGLEEISGGFLQLNGGGKTTDGSTGFVHVTVELINDIEPFLTGDVLIELSKTDLGLGEDGLLTCADGWVCRVVDGSVSHFSVDRVRRVNLGGLVRSVCGTLRVGCSVSDNSENRETWGLSGSGVGSNWNKGSSSSDDAVDGLTARGLW